MKMFEKEGDKIIAEECRKGFFIQEKVSSLCVDEQNEDPGDIREKI